jgi:2,3-bisphosphoglycerate-dependent phosphoglycerate mutase
MIENIYLVRHGESLGNIDQTAYKHTPDHNIPLSDRGLRQASKAGEALTKFIELPQDEPLRLWTSPYKRTRQTTEQIRQQLIVKFPQLEIREHINLCEQQFGLFDGLTDAEIKHKFPEEEAHYAFAEKHGGKFWARMPLGESRFDLTLRVHEAFGTFHRDAEKYGYKNLIIVCHGNTLRAFIMRWLHLPYEWFDQFPNPGNCDIYHIHYNQSGEGEYIYRSALDI